MSNPPVDLSFKELTHVAGALTEQPNSGLRDLKTNSEGKYRSSSLRLNNNSLTNLVGIDFLLRHIFAEPTKLGWLDLSFNKLTTIDTILCDLKELRVLYLHGNAIWNLEEVKKLRQLEHLHSITLHGNPVESTPKYRPYVIKTLRMLKRMDFSAVTPEELALAQLWCRRYKPGKAPTDTQPVCRSCSQKG